MMPIHPRPIPIPFSGLMPIWTHAIGTAALWPHPHPHHARHPRRLRLLAGILLVTLLSFPVSVSGQGWPSLSPDRWENISVTEVERLIAGNDLEEIDPNDGFYPGYTALLYALQWGSSNDVVIALIDAGADINTGSAPTTRPLHLAVAKADPTVARYMIARGVDLELEDMWGRTALHRAMTVGHVRPAVHDLIDAGANIHTRSETDRTLLHEAVQYADDPDIIHFVLGLGIDVLARDRFDRTALHQAAQHSSNPDVIRALVELGLDPDVRGDGERTPLHFTMRNREASIAETLIELGADVTAVSRRGDTPILSFARLGMAAGAIDALLDAEAPVDVRDRNGVSARDLLAENTWIPPADRNRLLRRMDDALADPSYGQRRAAGGTGTGTVHTDPTTAPPTSPTSLDHTANARHGASELVVDFLPDPAIIDVSAGGSVWNPHAGDECVGYIDPGTPTLHLDYVAGSYDLTIGATADADLSLTVRTPDGSVLCDDDGGRDLDPSLTISAPESGRYTIWLGAWDDVGVTHDARLALSEAGFGPHDEGAIPAADQGRPTTPPTAGLELSRTDLAPGDNVQVRFRGGPGNPRDWIGIYRAGEQPGTNFLAWLYVDDSQRPGPGSSDGHVTFFGLDLDPGEYDVWFMLDDGYEALAPALSFTVNAPRAPGGGVAPPNTSSNPSGTVTVDTPFLALTPPPRRFDIGGRNPNEVERFLARVEEATLAHVNSHRRGIGLGPFSSDAGVQAVARDLAWSASAEATGEETDLTHLRASDVVRNHLTDVRVGVAAWSGRSLSRASSTLLDDDPVDLGRSIAQRMIDAGQMGVIGSEVMQHAAVGVALARNGRGIYIRLLGAELDLRRFQIPYPLPGVVLRDSGPESVPVDVADRSRAEVEGFLARTEATLLALVNRFRAERSLPPLAAHAALDEVARAHSADMVLRNFYSHENPDGVRPHERVVRGLADEGVIRSAENIQTILGSVDVFFALGADQLAHRLFDNWIHSDGHRVNILRDNMTHIGLGVAFTASGDQVFGTQKFAALN